MESSDSVNETFDKQEEIFAWNIDEAAYDALLEDDDVLLNGEEEYGADCSAEFIMWYDSYLVWFKEAEQE